MWKACFIYTYLLPASHIYWLAKRPKSLFVKPISFSFSFSLTHSLTVFIWERERECVCVDCTIDEIVGSARLYLNTYTHTYSISGMQHIRNQIKQRIWRERDWRGNFLAQNRPEETWIVCNYVRKFIYTKKSSGYSNNNNSYENNNSKHNNSQTVMIAQTGFLKKRKKDEEFWFCDMFFFHFFSSLNGVYVWQAGK